MAVLKILNNMQILDLSNKPRVKGARFFEAPVNQLYHPTGQFGQDSCDLVYSRDLTDSKFLPILLKEWFYLVKKDGFLIIDYIPGRICNFQKLEETMWWLWNLKYDIIYHGSAEKSNFKNLTVKNPGLGYYRFICKKLEATKRPGDDINKWTFGIITKGDRNDWMDEMIVAIRAQKIPEFEIIVCGTYFDRNEKDFKYIPFFDRDEKGWITKKKNLIAREAKYENLCILHDRIVLDKNWFTGIKKYGNAFDILCNRQTLRGNGIRAGDWLTYGYGTLNSPYGISELRYNDWDEYVYMGGQVSILKKSIWEECPWNETLYWGEEDVELSFRFRDVGYLIRFNEFSSCSALAWRFGKLPSKYYSSEGLLPKDMLVRRFLRHINKILFSVPFLKQITTPIVVKIIKSKLYNLVIHS